MLIERMYNYGGIELITILPLMLLFGIALGTLTVNAHQSPTATYGIDNTPIVRLIEDQLASYYRPSFHGFVCFPSLLGGDFTDYYDYWADDAGKILTASVIVGNYTMAYEAFNFLYGIKAYGYMMPARIVQIMIHNFNNYYGNNIIMMGGCPLQLGVELFGFNYVASIESINGLGGCDYGMVMGNGSVKAVFGGVAEVVLGNFNYFLVKPIKANSITITFKPPEPIAYIYSGLRLINVINRFGEVEGNISGVASSTNDAAFGNSALFILGNISSVVISNGELTVRAHGEIKVYVAGVTVDYGSAPYIMRGLLLNDYPSDSDISTPASFGYIALGSALLGLRTNNATVLSFAKGFINFWLPIVRREINSGFFYPRSISTFLIAALLLNPNNDSIRQLALSYVESPVTLNSVKGGATGYGLTAWLISVLSSMGYNLGGVFKEYYGAQISALESFESSESPPLPIDYSIPYKAGEDLLGWLEAGLQYNDTNIVLPLLNIIFNRIIEPGANPPPFYAFFNYANTEGVPAILESISLWQAKMLNETGLTINRWRYLNVTGISVINNGSWVIINIRAHLMPPSGLLTHLELYIPFNPLNVSVSVNGIGLSQYANQSMYIPTQYYLTYMPEIPSGWFLNKTSHMLYIQYIPTPLELFNKSLINIIITITFKPKATASMMKETAVMNHIVSSTLLISILAAIILVIVIIIILGNIHGVGRRHLSAF